MSRLAPLFAVLLLGSCVEDPSNGSQGKALTKVERAECLMKGGTPVWGGMLAGNATESCMMPPPDEGKACRKASDCSNVCAAATRTCTWMRGEMTILNEDGEPVTGFLE